MDVPVTKTTFRKQLSEHPDYPSLLAISDTLKNIGVENISIKTTIDNLHKFPTPFIAQIKSDHENAFVNVIYTDDNQITYTRSGKKKEIVSSYEEFEKVFSGIVLLAEKTAHAGEKDYHKHLQEEKRINLIKILSITTIPAITIAACIICLLNYRAASIGAVVYTLLTLLGTITCSLLLWHEVDKNNPNLEKICTGAKTVNCNAILNSDASKIFGFSWSVIGFSYFAGGLITLLAEGIHNTSVLFTLSWWNAITIPYIAYSLYYQSRIAKQWCVLCLTVQAILALQFITSLVNHSFSINSGIPFQTSTVPTSISSIVISFLVANLLVPALRGAKENELSQKELRKIKYNPQIFEALLAKQKTISTPTDGLGITLGNANAKYKFIKVCNPYCAPCAKVHPAIEDLLENNPHVQVQIIFTATDDEKDSRSLPVRHLLAIAEKQNEANTKQALDDWYLSDKKDYEIFAVKYPMDEELKLQDEKLKAMSKWCKKTEIAFTPTFFLSLASSEEREQSITYHQLPAQYSVAELKYFLSV